MDSSSCALVKVRTTCVKHLELCILYLAQRQCPKDVRVLLSNLMVRCIVCTHMHQAHTHTVEVVLLHAHPHAAGGAAP